MKWFDLEWDRKTKVLGSLFGDWFRFVLIWFDEKKEREKNGFNSFVKEDKVVLVLLNNSISQNTNFVPID